MKKSKIDRLVESLSNIPSIEKKPQDWQSQLVEEGLYDESAFEEEDLEDDDYYFEDDE